MSKTKNGLLAPKASIGGSMKKQWYTMRASTKGSVVISIYDEIGNWGISAKQFAEELQGYSNINSIELRIHSPGGDVFEGMAIYNLLAQHPAHIDGYIDGLAASMGSVIAMACDVLHIPENAMMMIHKPWGIQGGDAEDMRRYADLLDKVEESLISAYMKKSGKSEEEIKDLLTDETWFTGQEAVEAGFADQLIAPLQAAAQLQSNRLKEFKTMPETLKALMKPKAQGKPPAANTPAAPVADPQDNDDPVLPEAAVNAAMAANSQRIKNIRAAFKPFAQQLGDNYQTMIDECVDDVNVTEQDAQAKLLAALGKQSDDGGHGHQVPSMIHRGDGSNGNLIGDSVRASIMARVGHAEAEADNQFNGYTLAELARASLVHRGIGIATSNRMQMLGMAFTHSSSDFGNILMDAAHKSMLMGWENAEETYHLWCKSGVLTDFKTHHRVGMGAFPSLRQVREGAEYKQISVSDHSEPILLATYGEIFAITRQTIINDDLQMLTTIPAKMGAAARGTIGDLAYAQLTSNPTLNATNKTLFHADHGNLGSGAPSVANLSVGRAAMRRQKLKDRNLNIRPAFVLAPVELEDTLTQIIKSKSVAGTDNNSEIANPVQNFAQVIGEPRLSDKSEKEFYLAAGKGQDTVEIAYLDGVDTPYMEQQDGFTVDGVQTKVRIDAAAKALDYRGMYKFTGE